MPLAEARGWLRLQVVVVVLVHVLLGEPRAEAFQPLGRARCYGGHICSVCDIVFLHMSCTSYRVEIVPPGLVRESLHATRVP